MTDGVLLSRRHFTDGAPFLGHIKDRVVAETASATRLTSNAPFECAVHYSVEAMRSGLSHCDNTMVARGPPLVGNGGESLKEDAKAILIGCLYACPARRVDPGLTSQRINLQSRIVGQGG